MPSCRLDVIFLFNMVVFLPGLYFLLLRRQNLTSWPPSRTCCVSVCVPRPSWSPWASSSPSSSTNCPDRRSSASFRYDTGLVIVAFVPTSPATLCAVTCSHLHLHPRCPAFRRCQTWSRHSRISPTWPARWDQVPHEVVGEKVFGHLVLLWCDVMRQVSSVKSVICNSCSQHLLASCNRSALSSSAGNVSARRRHTKVLNLFVYFWWNQTSSKRHEKTTLANIQGYPKTFFPKLQFYKMYFCSLHLPEAAKFKSFEKKKKEKLYCLSLICFIMLMGFTLRVTQARRGISPVCDITRGDEFKWCGR